MNREKELQLAKAPYNWLKASPLLTIPTLFFVSSFVASSDVFYYLCAGTFDCGSSGKQAMEFGVGVLGSALWHLLLLQYVNNKESELVREHGRKAMMQAGVRTGVAFFGILFDWLANGDGGFACIIVGILTLIWVVNATQSKGWVEGNNPPVPASPVEASSADHKPLVQPTKDMLDQIFAELDSEDDVIVLTAIDKLGSFSECNEDILKQLAELADKDNSIDIRKDARIAFNRFNNPKQPDHAISLEETMTENENRKPEEILNELYQRLQSEDDIVILQAIADLSNLNFSSAAIRRRLEKIAVSSDSPTVRADALTALDSPPNRTVQQRAAVRKLDRTVRMAILQEIEDWENSGLLDNQNAAVIRRRYDFDIMPQSAPAPFDTAQDKPVSTQTAIPTPQAVLPKSAAAESPAPVAPTRPPVPSEPRLSLLQTLTSEASIKIYLYLGAFFVIAAAAILGTVVPELRLPILIIGTLIFGGLSVAIKRRLPQPSFALFIVFSFLLPITANSLEETLRSAFNLSTVFSNGYWTLVFFIMAVIWGGGTWLYELRLFSITTFGSLILSFIRLGDVFDAEPVVYTLFMEFAALLGLAGMWLLKKWKDNKFANPLFFSAQVLHFINLGVSLVVFGATTFEPANENLWNLVALAVWGLAVVFFILSNRVYPFFAFPWLAAASLVPMPWFFAVAFDLESFGSAIVLFVWGAALCALSEGFRRFEFARKYGLPILLAALPSLALALFTGFVHEIWLGLIIATGIAFLLAILHILQTRWWLWTLALLNAIIAYFALFQLDFIKTLDIFFGYQVAVISMAFLLPDLLLKKDWSPAPAWRLPLRIFGALFALFLSVVLLMQNESGHTAICYALYAVFFTVYALAYRNAFISYLPAAYLPLAVVFALDALNIDAWLPALASLAVLYYLAGAALRNNQKWGAMLRNSGMALGAILSFAALSLTKETGGWYALVMGLLFISETYLRRNGWFEMGAPVLFTLGIFLILNDFNVEQVPYHLLAYSLVWLLADLLAHLTFANPRPLSVGVRGIGGLLALVNYAFLFTETNAWIPVIGYGIYTLLFLTISLLYRRPNLLYAFTLTLPLFVTFIFRAFDVTRWVHPVIVIAVMYYALGAFLRAIKRAPGWDLSLLYSGLGLGVIVSLGAMVLGGLDASIPVAIAATLWAFEAFSKRNAWLAFPANGLYLLAYFIILFEMNVDEPQFFSIGTALFGLIQHYLLTRAESKTGTFLMGMFSQFVLLGTTYIEMIDKNDLSYFFLLFIQSLVILVYGIVIRSRSLTFFPIGFVALGVVTVTYSALKDVGAIFVIGCTGILLLMLGVGAVLLRERIAKLGEKLSDWKA